MEKVLSSLIFYLLSPVVCSHFCNRNITNLNLAVPVPGPWYIHKVPFWLVWYSVLEYVYCITMLYHVINHDQIATSYSVVEISNDTRTLPFLIFAMG